MAASSADGGTGAGETARQAEAQAAYFGEADRRNEAGIVRFPDGHFVAIQEEHKDGRTCYVRLGEGAVAERRIIGHQTGAGVDYFYAETPSGIEHHTRAYGAGGVTETVQMTRESRSITDAAAELGIGEDSLPVAGSYHSVVLTGERNGDHRTMKIEVAEGKLGSTITDEHRVQLLVTESEKLCSIELGADGTFTVRQGSKPGLLVSVGIDLDTSRWTIGKAGQRGAVVHSGALQEWIDDEGRHRRVPVAGTDFTAGDIIIRDVAGGTEITVQAGAAAKATYSQWIRCTIGADDTVQVEVPARSGAPQSGKWAQERSLLGAAQPVRKSNGADTLLRGQLGWPEDRTTLDTGFGK